MSNLHMMIVHYVCKMIRRIAIRFYKDGIIIHFSSLNAWSPNFAIHQVFVHWVSPLERSKPDYVLFALSSPVIGFGFGDIGASPIVS
jgi:hypothetical protein